MTVDMEENGIVPLSDSIGSQMQKTKTNSQKILLP